MEDYEEAMACERFLDQSKSPSHFRREVFAPAVATVASMLASEAVRYIALGQQPTLAGRIVEYDPFELSLRSHALLEFPNCPVCSQKKKLPNKTPGLRQLMAHSAWCADLSSLESILVSPRFGIVKELDLIAREFSDPPQPYIVRSLLANSGFAMKDEHARNGASGKGLTVDAARVCALGEAVERYSSLFYETEEIKYARRPDLSGRSLDPKQLVLYRPDQYAHVDYSPFSQESILGWVSGRSLTRGDRLWLPALAVYLGYRPRSPEEIIFGGTSNGLAAGNTLPEAIYSAALEVIERDAVMIGWTNRTIAARWEPATHPDLEFRRMLKAYERRGIRIELFQMPTDLDVAVFLALGIAENERDLPAAAVGISAHPDPAKAAMKAFLELGQLRPGLRRRLRSTDIRDKMEALMADPRLVRGIDDHSLLYAHPSALRKLRFLREAPITRSDWPEIDGLRDFTWLVDHMASKGHELIYSDLTTHDMDRLGLRTVRAIIPSFQPIDFGFYQMRLGGNRLYSLPFEVGLRAREGTPETLNPDPHPFP